MNGQTMHNYRDILFTAAKEAGRIHLTYFRKGDLHPEYKESHHQLLLKADVESQAAVQRSLITSMLANGHAEEEIGFIGEEALFEPAEYTFIIDPLDGTTNFAFGINYFCASIALYKDAQPLAACTYVATTDTAYLAEIGQGAWKIEGGMTTPLHIKPTPLSDSIFVTPITYKEKEMARRIRMLETIQPHVQNMRVFGATALDYCLLADNQVQLVASGAQVWDVAAADMIIREAGGVTTDWEGNPFALELKNYKEREYFAACHPENLEEFIELIRKTA